MANSRHDHTILSRPLHVLWDGWESNTHLLQREGWEIVADQSMEYMFETRIMIRNPRSGVTGGCMINPEEYSHHYGMAHHSGPNQDRYRGSRPIRLKLFPDNTQFRRYSVMPPVVAHLMEHPNGYSAVDAQPQEVNMADLIHQMQIFAIAPTVEDENQIFAEPETVAELLDKIKEIQLPEQEQIRKRMKAREKREGGVIIKPSAQLQAQILSFK